MSTASSSNVRGIVAMIASQASFIVNDALIKLATRELPGGQAICVRGVAAFLIAITLASAFGQLGPWPTRREAPLIALRNVGEIGSTFFYLFALFNMPIADATAILQFLPLAITAGAAMFLGEPVGWRRWLATCVGFLGVLIIIRPGTSAFNWGAVLILACVASVAVRDLLTRRLGSHLPTLIVALSTMVAVTLSGLVRGLFEVWPMPTMGTLVLVASAAVTNCVGYYFGIVAMRSGDIAAVEPFRFSAIVFGVLLGVVVFGEVPDRTTILGILVVLAAGLYTLHRERVRGVRPATANVKEPHP
jgi:drug/metabolite transporter (DMT)-like permease